MTTPHLTSRRPRWLKNVREHYELYLLVLPTLLYFIVYHYLPMYGVQIAFRDYYPGMTITGAKWVGLENFQRFFNTYMCGKVLVNTFRISIMSLVLGFPMPILLALLLNAMRQQRLKKSLQMVSYAPYFISAVSMAGMLMVFLSERGVINMLRVALGANSVDFMGKGPYFPWIYVLGSVWKNTGWNSIIYIAALAGVDLSLYESAKIDGASKFQMICHIDVPSIVPTMVILLILNCGNLLSVGWEQILQMQNTLNTSHSEIISTYTYKVGLVSGEYSYSAAIGLFNSIVNLTLLTCVNGIARKAGETSLW